MGLRGPKPKPDRILWIGPSKGNGWRIRYKEAGKVHDHGEPSEELARQWAEKKALELIGSPSVSGRVSSAEERRVAAMCDYSGGSEAAGSTPAHGPKTPEDIVRLIDETIDGVRDGKIDPRRAPAIVQLAKARQALIAALPKEDDLGNWETMSHTELLRRLTDDLRTLCTADERWALAAGLTEEDEADEPEDEAGSALRPDHRPQGDQERQPDCAP